MPQILNNPPSYLLQNGAVAWLQANFTNAELDTLESQSQAYKQDALTMRNTAVTAHDFRVGINRTITVVGLDEQTLLLFGLYFKGDDKLHRSIFYSITPVRQSPARTIIISNLMAANTSEVPYKVVNGSTVFEDGYYFGEHGLTNLYFGVAA